MNEFTEQHFNAILRNNQLRTYFQPIVNLESGIITVIEARMRWHYSDSSVATASEVLQNIATIKKEDALDFLVFEQAHIALQELNANLVTDIRIAVNLSAATCLRDDFIDRLRQFILDQELLAFRFRLDIPQQVFSKSPQRVKNLVDNLSDRGFEVAVSHVKSAAKINDFLATLPVKLIKLDESLVHQLIENANSGNMAKKIITAASQSGFSVGAEGISRIDQLTQLRQIGCTEGQGMLISKPRPLAELMPLLRKGRCW